MSVIIEGFEKPKNCYSCPFNNSDCWCALTDGGYIDRDDWSCSTSCPIKELPKGHGDLIDRNSILCDDLACNLCGHTDECFKLLAPTIIEAESEEE